MNKRLVLTIICFCLIGNIAVTQVDPLIIEGGIGQYAIEMKITDSDSENGTFEGVYNYKGHNNTLTLTGEIYDECLLIKERYNGKETGEFYLDVEGDKLKGKWLDSSRWFSVDLKILSGDRSLITAQTLEDKNAHLSSAITGTYEVDYYFINDMWFRDDQPNIELGYNGGYFAVEEHHGDSLSFAFEVICGPTYHFAMGEGMAYKSDTFFVCQMYEECLLEISISNKKLKAVAHGSSIDCGFGARAHLDDTFIKTKEEFKALEER